MRDKMDNFPELPLSAWKPTKETFHRYLQIVGKIRLALMPRKNHWWYITLYTNSSGLTTRSIPYGNFVFEIQFDLIHHRLCLHSSKGDSQNFELYDGLSVADFYQKICAGLNTMGVFFDIIAKPYDLSDDIPFAECTLHKSYDREYVFRFWKILLQVDLVFKEFSGRSYSKTCPVHIYWHHMDLAVTRFSGKKGPEMTDAKAADRDAYSHEVISFGFWAGDKDVRFPAFYAYTYPSPDGLDNEPLMPESAEWIDSNGSPMAFLSYDALRELPNPKAALLEFLESAYQAGAKRTGWDIDELTVKPL
ncbi:MAG: DUF5996 family protein [Maribacter sp.]